MRTSPIGTHATLLACHPGRQTRAVPLRKIAFARSLYPCYARRTVYTGVPPPRSRDAKDPARDRSSRAGGPRGGMDGRGIVLRYGAFYWPGTSMAPGGMQLAM